MSIPQNNALSDKDFLDLQKLFNSHIPDSKSSVSLNEIKAIITTVGADTKDVDVDLIASNVTSRLDKDGNGEISFKEFIKVFQSKEKGDEIIEDFKDGLLEYLHKSSPKQGGKPRETKAKGKSGFSVEELARLRELFSKEDVDGDSVITLDELKLFLDIEKDTGGIPVDVDTTEYAKELMDKLDTNHDGSINFGEFVSGFGGSVEIPQENKVVKDFQEIVRKKLLIVEESPPIEGVDIRHSVKLIDNSPPSPLELSPLLTPAKQENPGDPEEKVVKHKDAKWMKKFEAQLLPDSSLRGGSAELVRKVENPSVIDLSGDLYKKKQVTDLTEKLESEKALREKEINEWKTKYEQIEKELENLNKKHELELNEELETRNKKHELELNDLNERLSRILKEKEKIESELEEINRLKEANDMMKEEEKKAWLDLDSKVHAQHEEARDALIEQHKKELIEERERKDAFWKDRLEKEVRDRLDKTNREWEQRLVSEREQLLNHQSQLHSMESPATSSSPSPSSTPSTTTTTTTVDQQQQQQQQHSSPISVSASKEGLSFYHNFLMHSQLILLLIVLLLIGLREFNQPSENNLYHHGFPQEGGFPHEGGII